LKSYVFKVVVEPDEHVDGRPAFRAYCPPLESYGASTWGDTTEEAMKNIGEVLHMIVDELAAEGKDIPPEALIAYRISRRVGDRLNIPRGMTAREIIHALETD
jgi:predicted RNase H-like HicB family nuclease